jgi:hypothetical protein
MVGSKSPAGLIDAASAWANHVVARKSQLTKKKMKEETSVD